MLSYISTDVPVCMFEETMAHCGVGETLIKEIRDAVPGCRVYHKDLGEKYIPHGAMDALYTHCGLNGEQIANFVREVCRREN
jgi:deoxyxylulose-5-phosphate synthase